jgi:hypothetical protein
MAEPMAVNQISMVWRRPVFCRSDSGSRTGDRQPPPGSSARSSHLRMPVPPPERRSDQVYLKSSSPLSGAHEAAVTGCAAINGASILDAYRPRSTP